MDKKKIRNIIIALLASLTLYVSKPDKSKTEKC